MDLDIRLGEAIATGERPPLVRIWRAGFAWGIGVSRKDVVSPAGRIAADTLEREGCSVVVRATGGTAVPQGEGVICVSCIVPRQVDAGTTDSFYRALCLPLIQWLRSYGLNPDTGALPGSYCDGSYNILVDGQKLVGTAQAWKGGLAGIKSARPGYIIAHACLPVDIDLAKAVATINRFYELAGDTYRVNPDTATTLRQLCPARFTGMTPAAAAERVADELLMFYREEDE